MQVAKEMENLGFTPEADFCSAMSHYIKACDDRGYDPDDRIEMMMPLPPVPLRNGQGYDPSFPPVWERNNIRS